MTAAQGNLSVVDEEELGAKLTAQVAALDPAMAALDPAMVALCGAEMAEEDWQVVEHYRSRSVPPEL